MARAKGVSFAFMAVLYICSMLGTEGATFEIHNNCRFTVWAAGSPGGGERLDRGQSWTLPILTKTTRGRLWGRTGCSFNSSGQGSCKTGDCEGLLYCKGFGAAPATLVEYSIDEKHLYDISLVDGFNLPMSIIPSNYSCPAISCNSTISPISPSELRVSDRCNSACTSFKTPQYCCPGNHSNSCSTSHYSKFFNGQCPGGYSYAKNDTASTFSCSRSTDYKVVFCGNATSFQGQFSVLLCESLGIIRVDFGES